MLLEGMMDFIIIIIIIIIIFKGYELWLIADLVWFTKRLNLITGGREKITLLLMFFEF